MRRRSRAGTWSATIVPLAVVLVLAVLVALAVLIGVGTSPDDRSVLAHDPDRATTVKMSEDQPERLVAPGQNGRSDSAALDLPGHEFDPDSEGKLDTLPALLPGMTLALLALGDSIFHNEGGCLNCHGANGEGLPARGKAVNRALSYLPAGDWRAIDSLVHVGMPEIVTRSPIEMPARGQHGNLTSSQMDAVAAYVWAISQTKGEPWPGGHRIHFVHDWRASGRTSIP